MFPLQVIHYIGYMCSSHLHVLVLLLGFPGLLIFDIYNESSVSLLCIRRFWSYIACCILDMLSYIDHLGLSHLFWYYMGLFMLVCKRASSRSPSILFISSIVQPLRQFLSKPFCISWCMAGISLLRKMSALLPFTRSLLVVVYMLTV